MKRHTLAPAAARDLVEIWRYIQKESSQNTAERVETVIREKMVLLAIAILHGARDVARLLLQRLH